MYRLNRHLSKMSALYLGSVFSVYNNSFVLGHISIGEMDHYVFFFKLSGENVTTYFDTSSAATEYRKLVLVMSSSVCENKNLTDFAHECGDSVSYIKKLFTKYAGISPKAYYNNLRIAHVLELLKAGKTINEISEEMNFSSSSYFSTFFKKHTGCSPILHKSGKD